MTAPEEKKPQQPEPHHSLHVESVGQIGKSSRDFIEMPKEHMDETNALLRSLAKQYGVGTALVGTHLFNLTNIVNGLLDERSTKLESAERESYRMLAMKCVRDTIQLLGANVGACCEEHVVAVAQAMREHTHRVEVEMRGDTALAAVADDAKSVLAKAAGGA